MLPNLYFSLPIEHSHREKFLCCIFFTCINLYFPSFRCVYIHTLLCLAEFHSNKMLHFDHTDDLAAPKPAGALGRGVSANHYFFHLLYNLFSKFFSYLRKISTQINKSIEETVSIQKCSTNECLNHQFHPQGDG